MISAMQSAYHLEYIYYYYYLENQLKLAITAEMSPDISKFDKSIPIKERTEGIFS